MPSFRLDKEPWIPVVRLDGSADELSLTEVFEQADQLASLIGTPLEVAAILRLLLGIGQVACAPNNFEEWSKFWDDPSSFATKCREYLAANQVWDLFDPDRPFLQDPRLRGCVLNGGEIRAAALEPVEPTFLNRGKLGTDAFIWHPAGAQLKLTPSEAARSLLVTHAFAVGGTGTPNPLIPKAKSGQDDKYSKSSLLAQSIVAFAETSPLDRLLLLNLLTAQKPGTPGWEFRPVESREPVASTGIADRYTRPAAAVLLEAQADGTVSHACVTIGPTFADEDSLDDPMVPHINVKDGYRPLRLDRSRALWRSAHVLLAESERPLAILSQLRRLATRGKLTGVSVGLRIVGIGGEPGKVKHYLWRDERLPLGVPVLSEDESGNSRRAVLLQTISAAEHERNRLRARLARFAWSYLGLEAPAEEDRIKSPESESPEQEDAGELSGYARKKEEAEKVRGFLGELVGFEKQKRGKDTVTVPLFNDFWAMLAPMGERIARDDFDEKRWVELLKTAANTAFRNAIDRLPPDARRFRAQTLEPQADGEDYRMTETPRSDLITALRELAHDRDNPKSPRRGHAAATLAQLRSGLGKRPGTAPCMFPFVADHLHSDDPCSPTSAAVFITAALFAKHPADGNAHRGRLLRNLGSCLWCATKRDSNPEGKHGEAGVEARFTAALDADPEDLPRHLEGLVSLCESASVPINWDRFYWDVRTLMDDDEERRTKTRIRWAREFWQGPRRAKESSETKEKTEE